VHSACVGEAELLLSSLLDRQYPEPSSVQTHISEIPGMLPLTTLATFVKETGRIGYYYRELSGLFEKGFLPRGWLAVRDFSPIWISVFRTISTTSSDYLDACNFLCHVLPILVNDHTEVDTLLTALDATLASALRTLVSMCILGQGEMPFPERKMPSNPGDLLRRIMMDCGISSSVSSGSGASLVAMSNLVIATIGGLNVRDVSGWHLPLVEIILRGSQDSQATINLERCLSEFVCSIARCCGRCSTDDGFEHLQSTLESLQGMVAIEALDTGHVLRRLVVEAAVAYSQQLPDQKHVRYAEQVETKLLGPPSQPRDSLSDTTSAHTTGFRWEEGISEWVTATPAMDSKKTRMMTYFSSDAESDCESSFKNSLLPYRKEPMESRGKTVECRRSSPFHSCPVSPHPDMLNKRNIQAMPVCANVSDLDSGKLSYQSQPQHAAWQTRTRRPVNKRRRFGDKILSSSQEWRMFEDSDDELSSCSLSQLESTMQVLAESQNSRRSSRDPTTVPTKKIFTLAQERTSPSTMVNWDSEDELSIL
jgi:hypothetical protein